MNLAQSRRARVVLAAAAAVVTVVAVILLLTQSRPVLVQRAAESLLTYDVAEAPPPPALVLQPPASASAAAADNGLFETGGAATAPIAVALPKLAYAYKLDFRLAGARIAAAQEAHRKLCADMGPARCQLVALERGAADDAEAHGLLRVRVDSRRAEAFTAALSRAIAREGGRAVATSVSAEDVSKDIVDAEARIRQRELLVSRLTELLRTRAGRVSELLEAERSVAQAQEELDQAKGWLTELRARVATSDITVTYAAVAAAASPRVAGNQLVEAVAGSGAAFLIALRGLLTLLIYLLPWLLIAVPAALVVRRRLRRTETAPVSEPVAAEG